jgi:hypothetical protein
MSDVHIMQREEFEPCNALTSLTLKLRICKAKNAQLEKERDGWEKAAKILKGVCGMLLDDRQDANLHAETESNYGS